jgi:hypothetical protein
MADGGMEQSGRHRWRCGVSRVLPHVNLSSCELVRIARVGPERTCVLTQTRVHPDPHNPPCVIALPNTTSSASVRHPPPSPHQQPHSPSMVILQSATRGPCSSGTRTDLRLPPPIMFLYLISKRQNCVMLPETREPIWGSPQPLDSVQDLKEWIHELRKPDGDRRAHLSLCLSLIGLTVFE